MKHGVHHGGGSWELRRWDTNGAFWSTSATVVQSELAGWSKLCDLVPSVKTTTNETEMKPRLFSRKGALEHCGYSIITTATRRGHMVSSWNESWFPRPGILQERPWKEYSLEIFIESDNAHCENIESILSMHTENARMPMRLED